MKKIPIGISNFERIINDNYYYIDKTMLIDELLSRPGQVTLIPRPRRFGKTLNLSMLHSFFELSSISKFSLFDGLSIGRLPHRMVHQGKYPVIFLNFKGVKHDNWLDCQGSIYGLIVDEFKRHSYLLENHNLDDFDKRDFIAIIDKTGTHDLFANSLKHLSRYLCHYYKVRPIVLIDEYDTPVHAGYMHNYFDEVITFMRNFLGEGLKDNNNLESAVITGILRIAKESIFSGLNNLHVCSLVDECNSDAFGFTEPEVIKMLDYYKLATSIDAVRTWYDGYSSGNTTIYNPWSINNYVNNNGRLDLYWVNTSSNDIIKDLLFSADSAAKEDLEQLMAGSSIQKRINSNIVFSELKEYADALWNFLLFSGYLTYRNLVFGGDNPVAEIYIPNKEVSTLFKNVIRFWFERGIAKKTYPHMLQSLVKGNIDDFTELFYEFVSNAFSQFDVHGNEPERFYHAFVLGMMVGIEKEYEIKSNRESGLGRYDVMLIPFDSEKNGVVIEFKKVSSYTQETLEIAVNKALQQIKAKNYTQELRARGIHKIIELGIAFEGKKVLVKQG